MIKLMTNNYINDVIKVHMQSFQDFFLTFLGARFLRLYYNRVINHRNAIKFVHVEDNKVKGFIVGTMNPSGFYAVLLRRDWFRFGIASIPAILRKPWSFFRLLHALTKPAHTPKNRNIAELSSIAVTSNVHNKGIGKEMVVAFINEVKDRGGSAIYLTTDAYNNDSVNAFYQKMGFKIKRCFETPQGRLMNEYFYEINDKEKGSNFKSC